MINKRYTITYDHWVGPHSPKPLLLLLPVIRNLTAVSTAHVRAHIGMRTLHYSHISKTTSVQTRLTLPQATSFPFLPPPFSPFLSPTTSLFASHFMLPLREKSHYFWFRGSYCPPLLHVMPVASLLQHHKRIWSSDLSARGNGSLEEWGVGENRDQERELKRERDYQGRIVVFRAVSLGMLGLVGSGHMMNTEYFYQQSKKTSRAKNMSLELGGRLQRKAAMDLLSPPSSFPPGVWEMVRSWSWSL